jgi:hypothetical protein
MLIKPPIDSRNTVCEQVVLIRLIPLQYIAHLFAEFPQITIGDTIIAMQQASFVVPKPMLKGQLLKNKLIISSPPEEGCSLK